MVRATVTALGAGIAAAAAAWFLLGDRSSPGALPGERIVAPPAVPPVVEQAGGVLAVLVLVVLVAIAVRRRDGPGVAVLVLLVLAGLLLGVIGRVVTAATIGANIGGGLAVLAGLPLAGGLVFAAAVIVVTAAVRRRGRVRAAR